MTIQKISLSFLALAASGGTAMAQYYDVDVDVEYEEPEMYSYAWSEPRLSSGIGIGVNIGGGVAGFTDGDMRDIVDTEVSGLWSARATIGTHIPLGLDLSYIGTAVDLDAPIGADSGTLIGTDFEAAARWNILPHYEFTPYLFVGAGWQHYEVSDAAFSTANDGLADSEDLAVFPMGIGFGYRDRNGITFDLRGTFRVAEESELVSDIVADNVDLHTWDASGTLGYEF
jgi:hypothetical protein